MNEYCLIGNLLQNNPIRYSLKNRTNYYRNGGKSMNMDEIRKVFKENELRDYNSSSQERKIVFAFDNNHTLSIEVKGHPGIHYDWDESVEVKVDGKLIVNI